MSAEPLASPFEAFKLARLVEERGRLRFAPLHRRDASAGYYDASAHAVCEAVTGPVPARVGSR